MTLCDHSRTVFWETLLPLPQAMHRKTIHFIVMRFSNSHTASPCLNAMHYANGRQRIFRLCCILLLQTSCDAICASSSPSSSSSSLAVHSSLQYVWFGWTFANIGMIRCRTSSDNDSNNNNHTNTPGTRIQMNGNRQMYIEVLSDYTYCHLANKKQKRNV